MSNNELYDKIIETYKELNSIKLTAAKLNTNTIKVRRVLITEGLWSSKTSEAVGELHKQGKSTAEIAAALFISEKNVQSYLPYTKGAYGNGTKNDDAERAAIYRDRKRNAEEGIKQLNGSSEVDETKLRKEDLKKTDEQQEEEKKKRQKEIEEGTFLIYHQRPIALKLHLELNLDDVGEKEKGYLKEYGHMSNGISRDVIIPSEMTLRALHYVIQRAFGWQNSHPHYFKVPDDVFDKLTKGSTDRWLRMCGVYFRFPEDNQEDIYWDADYNGKTSIRSWLKRKYTGPYYYAGAGDYYFENQIKVDNFRATYGKIKLDEVKNMRGLPQDINFLLERLSVPDYLNLPNNKSSYFAEPIDDVLEFLEGESQPLRTLWEEYTEDPFENFDQIDTLIKLSTIRMKSQTDELIYSYDYGDGWEVKVTCEDAYYKTDDPFYWLSENKYTHLTGEIELKDAFGNTVEPTLAKKIQNVCISQSPLCVASDGLNMFDDAGGVVGFAKFLKKLNTVTRKDILEELLETPKMYGWTAKVGKPESKL